MRPALKPAQEALTEGQIYIERFFFNLPLVAVKLLDLFDKAHDITTLPFSHPFIDEHA